MIVRQCSGEGHGSCKMCAEQCGYDRKWMCFLYHIDGLEGCYCMDHVKEISARRNEEVVIKKEE